MTSDVGCHYEGHYYAEPRGTTCLSCGEINWQLMSFFGHAGKEAKKRSIPIAQVLAEWEAQTRAEWEAELYDEEGPQ